MTRYFTADDGYGDSCIWEPTDGDPRLILAESDLPGSARDLWPALVAALDPDALRAEGWHAAQQASVAGPFPIRPEDCPYTDHRTDQGEPA